MSVDLSIIIVNWNGINFLPDCLKSIVENQPKSSFEIVLVDNDSSDNSIDWLESNEAKEILKSINFRLIKSGENLGFGRANNLAIGQTDSPYIFLLNPDTKVRPGAIDILLELLKSDSGIGMTAPKLIGTDGLAQANAWTVPTGTKIIVEGLKLYKFVPQRIRKMFSPLGTEDVDLKRETQIVSGAAMMVKRELIKEVGAFDPDIFMYGEDAEWCIRIGRGGWRIIYEPSAEITHLGGQSSIQLWDQATARIKEEEAGLEFQRKCFSPFLILRVVSARILVLSVFYFSAVFRRKESVQLKEIINLQLRGLKKAFLDLF